MAEKGIKRSTKKNTTTTKEKQQPTIVTLQDEEVVEEKQEITNTDVNPIIEFSDPIELVESNVVESKEESEVVNTLHDIEINEGIKTQKMGVNRVENIIETPTINEAKNILYTNTYFGRSYD